MLLRLAVFAMMALGLLGFGTVAWLALRSPAPSATIQPAPAAHHAVLVAAGPLRAGVLLKPEDVVPREIAAPPLDALEDGVEIRAGMLGAMLRRSLLAGEPLRAAEVLRPGDHGFLSAVLAPGLRAASVAVDAVSGSAGLIWPGDRVDVILTQTLEDPSLPAGRRVAAETVLSDVRVIAIDQLLAHGVAPTAEQAGTSRTVTLEVSAGDAERIAVATRLGRLSLAVRAAEQPTPDPAPADGAAPVAPRVLTTWGGDVSPALATPVQPKAPGTTLHLYQGNTDGKEFRF